VVGLLERPSSERHLDRVKYNSVLKSFEQYLTNVMERYLLPAKKKDGTLHLFCFEPLVNIFVMISLLSKCSFVLLSGNIFFY